MNKKARKGKAGGCLLSLWLKSQQWENTEPRCTQGLRAFSLQGRKLTSGQLPATKVALPLLKFSCRDISVPQSIQKRHFSLRIVTLSYLVVAVHGSSDLPAPLRSCCCGDAVAKGEGLVAMVAGRVLEWSLRGGVELQGTLGKKSRS